MAPRSGPTRYAALLRGINVGGRAKVPMAELRALLTDEGFTDVATLLQSGNVVLTSGASAATLEKQLESLLKARFDLTVPCLVRTGDELRAVAAVNPLADLADHGSKMMVVFLSDVPDPDGTAALEALDPGRIVLRGREIYQWCPEGILHSPDLHTYAEKTLKVRATGRNWNTVTKLAALLG